MGRRRHTPKQIITATSPPSVAPSHTQLSSTVLHSSDHAILDDSEEGRMTVIDWHVRQLEWWKKKLGISDYGVAWIAFAKGLVLGYALCFFI